MIRFVYIGDQINIGAREFLFYDTVKNRWWLNSVPFESEHDLAEFYKVFNVSKEDYDRAVSLIPAWYKNNESPQLR